MNTHSQNSWIFSSSTERGRTHEPFPHAWLIVDRANLVWNPGQVTAVASSSWLQWLLKIVIVFHNHSFTLSSSYYYILSTTFNNISWALEEFVCKSQLSIILSILGNHGALHEEKRVFCLKLRVDFVCENKHRTL